MKNLLSLACALFPARFSALVPALLFGGACTGAHAQTPANNPMPDGSRDLYLGLGLVSQNAYQGGAERRLRALPLVQLEWSNGVFIAGMSAGMHLSQRPGLEYGPLLALQVKRSGDGNGASLGDVSSASASEQALPGVLRRQGSGANALLGMDKIKARVQAGVFANYYLTPTLRLTNNVLYGAGNQRDGLLWNVALQHTAPDLTAHHRITYSAGVTLVNRRHNASFFGVTDSEALASGHGAYAPRGGVQDVNLGARWNWAISPDWIVTSGARVTRLQGDARHSPLVQRPTSFSMSSGLAYRF